MCAVFGYVGKADRKRWRETHRLLRQLAIASEVRGKDAAGYAGIAQDGSVVWARQPGRAGVLFCSKQYGHLAGTPMAMFIGHARLATNGAPAENGNNHPHMAGEWMVVHNGTLRAHQAVAQALHIRLKSQCDSELLAHLLERHGVKHGPAECLALWGSQSVLALATKQRVFLAWTDGNMPLVAFLVDGLPGTFWASTREIAVKAAAALGREVAFYTIKPNAVYRLRA